MMFDIRFTIGHIICGLSVFSNVLITTGNIFEIISIFNKNFFVNIILLIDWQHANNNDVSV